MRLSTPTATLVTSGAVDRIAVVSVFALLLRCLFSGSLTMLLLLLLLLVEEVGTVDVVVVEVVAIEVVAVAVFEVDDVITDGTAVIVEQIIIKIVDLNTNTN